MATAHPPSSWSNPQTCADHAAAPSLLGVWGSATVPSSVRGTETQALVWGGCAHPCPGEGETVQVPFPVQLMYPCFAQALLPPRAPYAPQLCYSWWEKSTAINPGARLCCLVSTCRRDIAHTHGSSRGPGVVEDAGGHCVHGGGPICCIPCLRLIFSLLCSMPWPGELESQPHPAARAGGGQGVPEGCQDTRRGVLSMRDPSLGWSPGSLGSLGLGAMG